MSRGFSAGNPIANVFVVIAGAVIIALSVVVGFFAFVVLGSIIAVLAAVVGLRMWWFNRKLKARMQGDSAPTNGSAGGVIEGEFHVVEDKRD